MTATDAAPLKILIVHPGNVIRDILKNYIRSDHPDAAITDTSASGELIHLVRCTRFDVVFSALEMEGMSGLDVRDILVSTDANAETPLVIMTSMALETVQNRLLEQGIRYLLPIPCTSIQFRSVLFDIFNPTANTQHIFYAVPNSRVLIRSGDMELEGRIIDIGRERMICELTGDDASMSDADIGALLHSGSAALQFPADYGKASTISLLGRISAVKLQPGISEDHLRLQCEMMWERFELRAATKQPLSLDFRLPVPDTLRVSEDVPPPRSEVSGDEITRLTNENQRLSEELEWLKGRIAGLEAAGGSPLPASQIPLDSMINAAATPTEDGKKQSIFKRLVEDNVKLRDKIG